MRLQGLMAKTKGHPLSQAYVASRQDALSPAPKALPPLPRTPYFLNPLYARFKRDALAAHCPSDKKTPASETVLIRQVESISFVLEGRADLTLPD